MNEIEKLYKNAGLSNMWVERYDDKEIWHKSYGEMISTMMQLNDWTKQVAIDVAKKECKKEFPPFTAEKQLELIKLLTQRCDLSISHFTEWEFIHFDGQEPIQITGKDFTETLAKLVNAYWQSLTEEERKQVKEVIE